MVEGELLPMEERTRAQYLCSSCGANISMVYLRPEAEKIHNRPRCESCGVPMARVGVDPGEHRIEYVDANTSYCHTCGRSIPNAHVRGHPEGDDL